MEMKLVNDYRTHLISLGQAGFLIKNKKGEVLAIDPYLSNCVENIESDHKGFKRLQPIPISPSNLILDILICTHFHRDHYDVDSVPLLMNSTKTVLFCPKDCEADAYNANIDTSRIKIIKPGDFAIKGDFVIRFINCDHGSDTPYAVGVIVETDGKRLLFLGDTCLRLDRLGEYLSFGPIDILIGPINGTFGNMTELDLVTLANHLEPKITIPCHYGMFAAHHGDVGRFYEMIKKTNRKCYIMAFCEDYIL